MRKFVKSDSSESFFCVNIKNILKIVKNIVLSNFINMKNLKIKNGEI